MILLPHFIATYLLYYLCSSRTFGSLSSTHTPAPRTHTHAHTHTLHACVMRHGWRVRRWTCAFVFTWFVEMEHILSMSEWVIGFGQRDPSPRGSSILLQALCLCLCPLPPHHFHGHSSSLPFSATPASFSLHLAVPCQHAVSLFFKQLPLLPDYSVPMPSCRPLFVSLVNVPSHDTSINGLENRLEEQCLPLPSWYFGWENFIVRTFLLGSSSVACLCTCMAFATSVMIGLDSHGVWFPSFSSDLWATNVDGDILHRRYLFHLSHTHDYDIRCMPAARFSLYSFLLLPPATTTFCAFYRRYGRRREGDDELHTHAHLTHSLFLAPHLFATHFITAPTTSL